MNNLLLDFKVTNNPTVSIELEFDRFVASGNVLTNLSNFDNFKMETKLKKNFVENFSYKCVFY